MPRGQRQWGLSAQEHSGRESQEVFLWGTWSSDLSHIIWRFCFLVSGSPLHWGKQHIMAPWYFQKHVKPSVHLLIRYHCLQHGNTCLLDPWHRWWCPVAHFSLSDCGEKLQSHSVFVFVSFCFGVQIRRTVLRAVFFFFLNPRFLSLY